MHTGNFKAVYQRARAHATLCNEEAARRDFNTVERLDPKLKPFIQLELKKLCETMRSVHVLQNKTYWDTAQERWGPVGDKTRSTAAAADDANREESSQKSAKADEKIENSEKEHKESSAETERVADAEVDPDVRAEQRIKEAESGRVSAEGLDNENM